MIKDRRGVCYLIVLTPREVLSKGLARSVLIISFQSIPRNSFTMLVKLFVPIENVMRDIRSYKIENVNFVHLIKSSIRIKLPAKCLNVKKKSSLLK